MIECGGLTRTFGAFTAVDGLSFRVEPGAICAFLGANGAGKSTTLKMLTGLLAPSSGTAHVCGLDVAGQPVELKRRVGVLPENLGLFDDLTVAEHLRLTADVHGLTRAAAEARSAQLLRVLDLERGRDTFASQCSHGMRKKTALAMALLPNPEVLFLDEPFEAIDPVTSRIILDLLASCARHGVTVFLTSHILPVVERLASQFIIIGSGRLTFDSAVEGITRPLEEIYFERAEAARTEDLTWLGPRPS
jgi:ABC-2 type transport system ATP-binding protein